MDIYEDTKDLYTRVARGFDQSRNKKLFEKPQLDAFLSRCPSNPEILYLGSGAGQPVAQYLIDQGAQITGVDFAVPMLEITRERYPDHTWIECDMRHVDLDKRFDAIISFSGMFHLTREDQVEMFPLFRTHLKVGGAILITTGVEDGETYGSVEGEPLYCASLDADRYRDLFAANGFGDIDYSPEDPDCGGFTLWLATRVS